jgi:hypothetical protein
VGIGLFVSGPAILEATTWEAETWVTLNCGTFLSEYQNVAWAASSASPPLWVIRWQIIGHASDEELAATGRPGRDNAVAGPSVKSG